MIDSNRHPYQSKQGTVWLGIKAITPFLIGVIPFGLISGIAAAKAGLSFALALLMSMGIFAGASQLATVQLLEVDAAYWIMLATALVINLRMVMYSASLAPHFAPFSKRLRALIAYLLTDQAYAVSILRFDNAPKLPSELKPWYYLGVAVPMWLMWQFCTIIGFMLGTGVPESWSLDFAIPLAFIVLVVPAIRSRPMLVAAVVAAIVAVIAYSLPFNLGLLVATVAGIIAGFGAEQLRKHGT